MPASSCGGRRSRTPSSHADSDTVIGCLYIYPSERPGVDAKIRSWVRAADADLDPVLYRVVTDWLATSWPFEEIEYAERPGA